MYTLNSLSSRCPLISVSAELFSLSDLMCACTSPLSLVVSCSVPPLPPAGLEGGGGRSGFDGGRRGACHTHVQWTSFHLVFCKVTFLLGLGGICGLAPDRSRASVDVSMVMGSSWISMDPVESALTLVRGTISSSLEGLVVSSCSLVVEARFRGFYRDKKINIMMVLSNEEVND